MAPINPFKPNSPISPGMFVGRTVEINRLEAHLVQTAAGSPSNFMVTGERGIGKSSMLNYFKWVAEGYVPISEDQQTNFLVIDIDVDQNTTPLGLVRRVELGIRKKLGDSEKTRTFLKSSWAFLQRFEGGGFRVNPKESVDLDEVAVDEFCYSLSEIVGRLCSEDKDVFSARYDGVVLLIDEADNAPRELGLGAFLKLLLERLERRGCNRLMVGLAGLTELRNRLHASHPSSLRLFDELTLERLSEDEVNQVVDRALDKAEADNGFRTGITDEARSHLVSYSEGYPHFIQQFGYSAFAADGDNLIDKGDFIRGAFGKRGAMEQIGDRYYRDSFYNKIKEESYRQVLRIMADNLDGWVSKSEIKDKFKGSASTLDSAIKALRERHIIFSKEGERGVYRLQHKGFAFWIKVYASQQELSLLEPDSSIATEAGSPAAAVD